ncbi:MAG TPA: hypothetical protein VKU85_15000, partial [bacterium]|nr:hypothetical protein [bacterium]
MRRLAPTTAAAALLVALPGLTALSGCGDDTSGPSGGGNVVQASFTGIPESTTYLGHLELWISFAETRTGGALRHSTNASAGKFKILNGEVVGLDYQPMTFALNTEDPDVPLGNGGEVLWQLAVDAFVSIEPDDDPDPSDPNAVLLGGAFLNRAAALGVDHGDGLDNDFASVAGTFQLATPSTSADADSLEGCWFATPGPTPAASLTLPTL